MVKRNILIVCWDFPPNNAIGGRRWAKIARSLVKTGHHVSVISRRPKSVSQKLAWIDNDTNTAIKHYHCDEHFLVTWLNDYNSPLKSLKVRIAGNVLSSRYKGTIYDKAIGIEKKFIDLATKVIQENAIDLLFVTGAPFNLLYYCAKLKQMFPTLTMLGDYRDPWIHAENYGMKNLSPERKQQELDKQNTVFENLDFVTAPNIFLLNEIKQGYTGHKTKLAQFFELPHAFDPGDVRSQPENSKSGQNIRLIYAGSLYLHIDEHLKRLNAAISHFRKHEPGTSLMVTLYCPETGKHTLFEGNTDIVSLNPPIGDRVFDEIASSDYVLILLSAHNKNYLTSKFFEFLPYGKPYIYVGPDGYVSDKIKKDKLGFVIETEADLLANIKNPSSLNVGDKNKLAAYSFDTLTTNLLDRVS